MAEDLLWFPPWAVFLALRLYQCSEKHYEVGTHLPPHQGRGVVPSDLQHPMLLVLPVAHLG